MRYQAGVYTARNPWLNLSPQSDLWYGGRAPVLAEESGEGSTQPEHSRDWTKQSSGIERVLTQMAEEQPQEGVRSKA